MKIYQIYLSDKNSESGEMCLEVTRKNLPSINGKSASVHDVYPFQTIHTIDHRTVVIPISSITRIEERKRNLIEELIALNADEEYCPEKSPYEDLESLEIFDKSLIPIEKLKRTYSFKQEDIDKKANKCWNKSMNHVIHSLTGRISREIEKVGRYGHTRLFLFEEGRSFPKSYFPECEEFCKMFSVRCAKDISEKAPWMRYDTSERYTLEESIKYIQDSIIKSFKILGYEIIDDNEDIYVSWRSLAEQ